MIGIRLAPISIYNSGFFDISPSGHERCSTLADKLVRRYLWVLKAFKGFSGGFYPIIERKRVFYFFIRNYMLVKSAALELE